MSKDSSELYAKLVERWGQPETGKGIAVAEKPVEQNEETQTVADDGAEQAQQIAAQIRATFASKPQETKPSEELKPEEEGKKIGLLNGLHIWDKPKGTMARNWKTEFEAKAGKVA
jgi:hypothetical protein